MGRWLDFRESVLNSFRDQAAKGVLNYSGYAAATGQVMDRAYTYDAYGNITGIDPSYAASVERLYYNEASEQGRGLGSSTSVKAQIDEKNNNKTDVGKWGKIENMGKAEQQYGPKATRAVNSIQKFNYNTFSDQFKLKLPNWGYDDFINERAIWQKGLSSAFDEPAWFYFKITFDFDTFNGLFGGLLNVAAVKNNYAKIGNSALTYLNSCRTMYRQEKISDRIEALYKFASILSFINTNAPWYFKSVKGLDKVSTPIVTDFTAERSIDLELNTEAIDMRLSTLMSLYHYACYDRFNGKEIIPHNLRLFSMSIIIFQVPLRYLHTSYISNTKTVSPPLNFYVSDDTVDKFSQKIDLPELKKFNTARISQNIPGNDKQNYKRMTNLKNGNEDISNMMSMKIFTFDGCEFDSGSFSNIIPASVSNETPFKMGESSIKINYTQCTVHTVNEFFGMMFGSDGFYFHQYAKYQEGPNYNKYKKMLKEYENNQKNRYQALKDTLEDIARGGKVLGIDSIKSYKKAVDASEAIINGVLSENNIFETLGADYLLRKLHSSYSTNAQLGNIYGDVGIGSQRFLDELNKLKNGTGNKYTTKSYNYNPSNANKGYQNPNQSNKFTEAPYDYASENARDIEYKKAINSDNVTSSDINKYMQKNTMLIDNTEFNNANEFTENPYEYNSSKTINYEYNKTIAQPIIKNANERRLSNLKTPQAQRNMSLVDGYGDNAYNEYTEAPYNYDHNNANNGHQNPNQSEPGTFTENPTNGDPLSNHTHLNPNNSNGTFTENPRDYKNNNSNNSNNSNNQNDSSNGAFTEPPTIYRNKSNNSSNQNDSSNGVFTEPPTIYGSNQKDKTNVTNFQHNNQFTNSPHSYDSKHIKEAELANQKEIGTFTSNSRNYDPMIDMPNNENRKTLNANINPDIVGMPPMSTKPDSYTQDPILFDGNTEKIHRQYNGTELSDATLSDKPLNNFSYVRKDLNKFTQYPYEYDAQNAVSYERDKDIDTHNGLITTARDLGLIDAYGNNKPNEYTEAPYNYDPKVNFNLNNWLNNNKK